ncbi:SRPBCC family protein [Leptospira noguchii]|uniref:Polyketide cyclase/dehydrase and lipid transport n=2 Tax=Leptospira noguchii TaxID=28182 RepID=M6U9J2_9LEPT|nr:SRPBCC family protein [Leptospira noguchii]EMO25729.1 polyketide cyclase/dehydrase and lipid transport [Leptospira interrogans serovar Bataviae str. HAI135]EKR72614.1 polyketide cyclase/dehydrase and lipid transport [Leptospira noguchii str. 2006001870]EMI65051.1 polyketide cyclase/dehydrase and lipid transport [Leptospira noguchii str. Bonito]EMO41682.1 polyketide cyclase/dehydrase and lipid transport [Leptospira noguchii serovar Autumnalis str. ZUN142]EMS87287.1 polyketide cyclase/dehydra
MKIVFSLLGMICVLGLGFFGLGAFANPKFEGNISATVNAPVERVFQHLLNLEEIPKYRKEVIHVILEGKNTKGYPIWKEEVDMGGYIHFEMTEREENSRVRVEMKESSFGMKGSWDYKLQSDGNKTKITINEVSEVSSIPIRAIFMIVGKDANLKKELEILNTVFP